MHFQRIETNVGLGVPDVNGCGDGVEFWLELKVSSNKQSSLSKYQKAWIIRRGRVGVEYLSCKRPSDRDA